MYLKLFVEHYTSELMAGDHLVVALLAKQRGGEMTDMIIMT